MKKQFVHHNTFIILTGLVLWTQAKFVNNPFWYQDNTLRCNCEPNSQCNDKDGTCSKDKCAVPYVGINCQHADISLETSKRPTNVPANLRDGNDTTCETQLGSTPLFYEIEKPIHLIWIYIVRKSTLPMAPKVTLYHRRRDIDATFSHLKLNENSLLIKTRGEVLYSKMIVTSLPPDICTFEVSIGRNLAIPSSPELWYVRGKVLDTSSDAIYAVDGNDGHCFWIQVQQLDAKQYWLTRLRHDAWVNRIVFITDLDKQYGMWKLEFTLKDSTRRSVASPREHVRAGNNNSRVSFNIAATKPVRELRVTISRAYNGALLNFHICQLYMFGEFICPEGRLGAFCEKPCPGCLPGLCDQDWGCPQGCKDNWIGNWCNETCAFRYGPNCTFVCPDGCAGTGDCNSTTGACLEGCKPGLEHPKCTEPCRPGTYGQNCSKTCSYCARNETTNDFSCDAELGECLHGCGEGFLGDHCEKLIVQDDVMMRTTKYTLAGFVALAILLMYKSAAGPAEEATTEEEPGEELQLGQTEPKEQELGTMGSLAETPADPQTAQDGPNRLEEPVKTKPKTSEFVALDKGIKSSNGSKVSQKKPNPMEESVKTEYKKKEVVNIENVIKSTNESQIKEQKPKLMEEPVKTELKNSELVNAEKVMKSSNESQTTEKKPKLIAEPMKIEPKISEAVNPEKVIESPNDSHIRQKKPQLTEETIKTELKTAEAINTEKVIESPNDSHIRQKESNRLEEPAKTETNEIEASDPKEGSFFYQLWSQSETEPDH